MTTSQSTGYNVVFPSNHSLPDNSTSQNVTSVCGGAGTYADGTCLTIWPFWVEVTVPLCCVLFFLLTLTIVYLRPVGSTSENDSCKQHLNTDEMERTEFDQNTSSRETGDKASSDTKV